MASGNYLQRNAAPVHEELTVTELPVTGTLPAHLDGRYLRNGPNPVSEVDPATYHWFTGTGMVHGVRLRDGKAEWYRNRYVRSAEVAEALGEDLHPGPVHMDMDFAANTHVIGHAGRTFAIVEAGSRPYELTHELDTVGPCDFDGTLPGGYTAHPHRDPITGELHAVSYFWGWGNNVQYSVIDVDGKVRHTVDIPVTGSPMVHDFALTESHIVLYDLPVTFDLEQAAVGFPYAWNPDYPSRVGVMPRAGGADDVRWFDVDPCYVFHTLNAYDDDSGIVLDVVRHPRMFDTDRNGPNEGASPLYRWTLDTASGKALEEQLDDHSEEFPRIDDRVTGRKHRYGYALGLASDTDSTPYTGVGIVPATLVKHDLTAGTSATHSFGPGTEPGEFVFVPNSPDAAEDDGVLMGFVYNQADDRSDLTLIDAATFSPVATVHLPTRVPHGFHGSWIPS
jgi:carotenoid cleavage dioxygenase